MIGIETKRTAMASTDAGHIPRFEQPHVNVDAADNVVTKVPPASTGIHQSNESDQSNIE